MRLRVTATVIISFALLVAIGIIFVMSSAPQTGTQGVSGSNSARNGSSVASNSNHSSFYGGVPTVNGGVPDAVATAYGIPSDGLPPNPLATREAALSATIPPTATPVPPTRTPMPAGWERLGELAYGAPGETYEEGERRHKALRDLLDGLPGIVIAQDRVTPPRCYDGPSGYRIEEVLLPGMVEFDMGGKLITDKYWRVIIEGGHFPEFDESQGLGLGLGLWVDNVVMYDVWLLNPDKTEVRFLILHPPFGYEGSIMGLQYNPNRKIDLPMQLHFAEGRPERLILVPTPFPTLAPGAYETTLAKQGHIRPTVDRTMQAKINTQEILSRREGKIIAQNQYSTSTCSRKPGGYKIEEVILPQETTLDIKGVQVSASKFWRITLDNLGSSGITSMRPAEIRIQIGNTSFKEVSSYTPLAAVAFDISGIHEGDSITIYTDFGIGAPGSAVATPRAVLPEKLHFLSNPTVASPPPDPTEVACVKRVEMYDFLYTSKGRVIGQGQNSLPTCLLNLLTYRVEQVDLLGPTTFVLDEGTYIVSKFWRLVITSSKPNMAAWMRLDGTILPVKGSSGNPNEVVALVFNRSLLREGAKISFSYEYQTEGESLPETLHLDVLP